MLVQYMLLGTGHIAHSMHTHCGTCLVPYNIIINLLFSAFTVLIMYACVLAIKQVLLKCYQFGVKCLLAVVPCHVVTVAVQYHHVACSVHTACIEGSEERVQCIIVYHSVTE
jgi:hypothetical protein